jgi:hypothetical protein
MKLAQCLNRMILVSIPSFFGDDVAQPCTLVEIEPVGLWLESEAFAERLPEAHRKPDFLPTVTLFFPFSQILYVFDPEQFARRARAFTAGVVPSQRAQPESRQAESVLPERRKRVPTPKRKRGR